MAPKMKRPAAAQAGGPPQKKAAVPLAQVSPGRVPVYVMLQLDWLSEDGSSLRHPQQLAEQLQLLRLAGVRGVMADIWWGLCEPECGQYRFGGAVELCKLVEAAGLKLQAVMSFHQCGGNVGDAVTIPLPLWALGVAREKGLLYRSSSGVVSEDCLSLSADRERVFPSVGGELRTALECYRDFVAAFATAVGSHLGATVEELQVGMGPCGELRYPSYMLSNGWEYPGVGLVMAYDDGMRRQLAEATGLQEPPAGLPENQNGLPDDSDFFRAGDGSAPHFRSDSGRAFLEWYSRVLVCHGRDMLKAAALGLAQAGASPPASGLAFSAKVSGLHWHVMHPSRATEACAGYDNCSSDTADAYCSIAKMLAEASQEVGRPVLFNFTCLEMSNWSNSMPQTLSAPEDLIAQVRQACVRHGVPLAGENALEFNVADGGWAFEQMRKQLRGWSPGRDRMHGLTILRLSEAFVADEALRKLGDFVGST